MKTLLVLILVLIAVATYLWAKSSWGDGLVDEARQWWRLRTMQLAAALGTIPTGLAIYVEYFGSLWPEATQWALQVLPAGAHQTIVVIGGLLAIARLGIQRGIPRWPSPRPVDPTDQAGV